MPPQPPHPEPSIWSEWRAALRKSPATVGPAGSRADSSLSARAAGMIAEWARAPVVRRWAAVLISAPVLLSLTVHAGIALVARQARWTAPRPAPLTDLPANESVLTLGPEEETIAAEPAPPPPPAPVDPPPEVTPDDPAPPEPEPQPEPEAQAPEVTADEDAALTIPHPSPTPPPPPLPAPKVAPPPTEDAPVSTDPAPVVVPPSSATPTPGATVTTFAGVKADRADRVVYVVDASGAMVSNLPFVVNELSRSIGRLDQSQQFQVILFRDAAGGVSGGSLLGFESFRLPGSGAAGLIQATESNKDAARAWLKTVRPLGRSAPLPGLRAALALRPDVVFLLTRSITRTGAAPQWDLGNEAVLKNLDQLNPRDSGTGQRPVVVKTIQFIDDDPSGLLQAIAREHGDGQGSYTIRKIGEVQ